MTGTYSEKIAAQLIRLQKHRYNGLFLQTVNFDLKRLYISRRILDAPVPRLKAMALLVRRHTRILDKVSLCVCFGLRDEFD